MLMSGLTITAQRQEVVDFTYPFWYEPMGMLTLTIPQDNFFLFKPLRGLVWAVYLLSAVIIAALLWFSTIHIIYYRHIERSQQKYTRSDIIWYTIGASVSQGNVHFRWSQWYLL